MIIISQRSKKHNLQKAFIVFSNLVLQRGFACISFRLAGSGKMK